MPASSCFLIPPTPKPPHRPNPTDPATKAGLAHRAWSTYCAGTLPLGTRAQTAPLPTPARPARPQRPRLVTPKQVPAPKDSPLPLPAHMLHNLAHIELNAIDLAMDTVARFAHLQLPPAFYEDFARVADDESRHFCWSLQRLHEMGADYGDMVSGWMDGWMDGCVHVGVFVIGVCHTPSSIRGSAARSKTQPASLLHPHLLRSSTPPPSTHHPPTIHPPTIHPPTTLRWRTTCCGRAPSCRPAI